MWGAASQLAGRIHTQQSRQPRMGTGGVMVDVTRHTHPLSGTRSPNTEGEARTRGVTLCPLAPSNQGTTRHVTRPSLARCPDKTTDTTAQRVEQSAGEKRETVEQSRPGTLYTSQHCRRAANAANQWVGSPNIPAQRTFRYLSKLLEEQVMFNLGLLRFPLGTVKVQEYIIPHR
jgi:hypothetical protein